MRIHAQREKNSHCDRSIKVLDTIGQTHFLLSRHSAIINLPCWSNPGIQGKSFYLHSKAEESSDRDMRSCVRWQLPNRMDLLREHGFYSPHTDVCWIVFNFCPPPPTTTQQGGVYSITLIGSRTANLCNQAHTLLRLIEWQSYQGVFRLRSSHSRPDTIHVRTLKHCGL